MLRMKKLLLAFIAVFLLAGLSSAEEPLKNTQERFRLGLGVGIPYGGVGVNLELLPEDIIALTAGAGVGVDGPGWAAGLRLYPLKKAGKFSPRMSVYYGTVAVLKDSNGYNMDTGAAYGAGFDYKLSNNFIRGIDFELLYVDYETPEGYVEEDGGDIKLSIGYEFVF